MHSRHIVLELDRLGLADVPSGELGLDDVGGPRSAYLLRPFLDLTPFGPGCTDASAVECAFHQMADGTSPRHMIQTHPAPQLRSLLIKEVGLPAYDVTRAAQLPPRLRTPRWQVLVDAVAAAERPGLPTEQQVRLATLLNTLGLYTETVRLFSAVADAGPHPDPVTTTLRIRYAMAVHRTRQSTESANFNLQVLREAAEDSRGEPHVRLGAAITLLVWFAKGRARDLAQVHRWRELADGLYPLLRPEDGLPDVLSASTYWRAVSYTRYLAGDFAGTAEELDEAERLAGEFRPRDDIEWMLWGQNMHPLLETRGREAFDAGDLELARQRIGRLADLDPLHPKVHLQVGSLELAAGQPERALAAYRTAADLGAPWTSFAWFMIGHCLELLGDGRAAEQAFVQAIRVDPGNIDARRRIAARPAGTPFLTGWAASSLTDITRRLRSATARKGAAA